jgi:uncharacterized protein YgiM (DUF1202 family)
VSGLGKVVRALIGLVVVVVLLLTVRAWYGDYRTAARKAALASRTSSRSVAATGSVVPVQGQKVAILVDGLSLRSAPDTATKSVRPLKKGEQLLLVGVNTQTNWLQLRDGTGKLGYLLNSASAVRVQK